MLLAVAWLPYLMIQCPACQGATSSRVECNGHTDPDRSDVDAVGHAHGLSNVRPVADQEGARSDADHCHQSAGGGCCSWCGTRSATLAASMDVPPPSTAILTPPMMPREHASLVDRPRPVSVEPHQHAPPLYLRCLTLLL